MWLGISTSECSPWACWESPQRSEDGFRHATVAFFRENEVVFELKAQLWADAERQPIEDASVDWPVSVSPYRTVADLAGPASKCTCPSRKFPCKHALGLMLVETAAPLAEAPARRGEHGNIPL